jgi:SNF2 family DNA or RNA helicase
MLDFYYPDQAVDYTADCSPSSRETAYIDFTNHKRDNDNKWIMLGTVATVGLGLNLQRAHYVILYEPCGNRTTVEQLVKRVCRRGQVEPVSYVYILVNAASAIEKRLAAKMENMNKLQAHLEETEGLRT